MRVEVVGRNVPITDPIREHAEHKASKLPHYFNGVQQITFTMTQDNHSHSPTFDVELIIDVVHHEDFVCHAKGTDLYAAIDQAVQKGVRLLTDFKEKLRQEKR